jgi:hypothetical protein
VAYTTVVATERLSSKGAGERTKWPTTPEAPRWMAWTPQAAVVGALLYGTMRAWWAVNGSPAFGRLGSDLVVFTGWPAVALCATTAVVALALRTARWMWPLFVIGWAVCVALLVSCPMLLLDAVSLLFRGSGVPFNLTAFGSRAACFAEALLAGSAVVAYRRRWCSACLFCGGTALKVPCESPSDT